MSRALSLAARGSGKTSPNPMVGAVLVKGGRVIAENYHKKPGSPHAEALVLKMAGTHARGSVLYVNLEPCCHYNKRTPPCSQALVRAGVKRVVIGERDPNPRVSGRGISILKKSGIRTLVGVLSQKEIRLNAVYRKTIRTGRPFVISKAAVSLDGSLTPPGRSSGWITGVRARRDGHRIRSEVDAVLVGINTVLRDNPRLTNRSGRKKNKHPLRVILDSGLRIPLRSRVLDNKKGGCLIFGTKKASGSKVRALENRGVGVSLVPGRKDRVDFSWVIQQLGKMGIQSVLVEGGAEVHRSALASGQVDKLVWYIAPKIFPSSSARKGGAPRIGTDSVPGFEKIVLKEVSLRKIGRDFRVEACLR